MWRHYLFKLQQLSSKHEINFDVKIGLGDEGIYDLLRFTSENVGVLTYQLNRLEAINSTVRLKKNGKRLMG